MAKFAIRGDAGVENASYQRMNWEEKIALRQTAAALGISPSHLMSAMLYEMAANPTKTQGIVFNPNIKNPESTAQGAIQFIKSNWEWTGYKPGMSFLEQIQPNGPVHKFLAGNGVKPGMGFEQIYRTIHTGSPTGNQRDGASGRWTSELWKEAWGRWKGIGVSNLYELDPLSNKMYLPDLPPFMGPRPKELQGAPMAENVPPPSLKPSTKWAQVPNLTQPGKRVFLAPIPAAATPAAPERARLPIQTRMPQRDVDTQAVRDSFYFGIPGKGVTKKEAGAIRQQMLDDDSYAPGALGTRETQLHFDKFEQDLSPEEVDNLTQPKGPPAQPFNVLPTNANPPRVRVEPQTIAPRPRPAPPSAPIAPIKRPPATPAPPPVTTRSIAPLPGSDTVKGPAIETPQPGATTGVDSITRRSPRPGAYPIEDTPRPYDPVKLPVGLPNSSMTMGIAPKEKTLSPTPEAPVTPATPTALPDEIPPETVTPAPVAPPASVEPAAPEAPAPAPERAPGRVTFPVKLPSLPKVSIFPSKQQEQAPALMFPTSNQRLAPAGATNLGPVTQGSPAIASSKSGGPNATYQTSQDSRGNGMVSWVRSDGTTITTYQDPSKGGGAIHGGSSGQPVKTSGTSLSLNPGGASLW